MTRAMRRKIGTILAMWTVALMAGNTLSAQTTTYEIPDSLRSQVDLLLSGKGIVIRDPDFHDPDEMVLVKGDTVPMHSKERNFGRFDRGLFNHLFIPKGTWQFGLTASYGEFSTDDYQLLDLLSDFDFSGSTFSIRPSVSYFIGNNASMGIRLGYTSSKGTLGALNVDFDEDLNFAISDASYKSESYTAAVTYRQYIGLSRRGRFAVFNDVELAFSSGHSEFNRKYDDVPKITKTTSTETQLNFSPGVCMFLMKNACFNVSFGVVGFYLRKEHQRVDGVEVGDRFSSGANFRFNVFNINFGLGIQI